MLGTPWRCPGPAWPAALGLLIGTGQHDFATENAAHGFRGPSKPGFGLLGWNTYYCVWPIPYRACGGGYEAVAGALALLPS